MTTTDMRPIRISPEDIERVKRDHLLRNMRYTAREAAEVLSISVKTLFRLEDEGLIASEPIRPGQTGDRRYTALSIEVYRSKLSL